MTEPGGSNSETYIVVIIEHDDEQTRAISRDRIIARTIGEALDVFAPDPAPGVAFRVEYQGRARWAST